LNTVLYNNNVLKVVTSLGIKERKAREVDHRRELILTAAEEIISSEGIDKLSVRKIAAKIEYSPSLIYHYFKDKDEILKHLMEKSYKKIVALLISVQSSTEDPTDKIRKMTESYIHLALQMPEQYKTIMLNSSPDILAHTSVLFDGASTKRQAVAILCKCLKQIDKYKNADDKQIELTAQIIWATTFGLIIRMIIENEIDEKQKNLLIQHHIQHIENGIIQGKT